MKKYAKRGLIVVKRHRVRCIGPASLKNADHGYWSSNSKLKIGMCLPCQKKIADMRLSPMCENPLHGEVE